MKKTKEEYLTQAMLLGMDYSELVHCFVKNNYTAPDDWYDADTMEPVTEKLKRISVWAGERPPAPKPGMIVTWEGKPI